MAVIGKKSTGGKNKNTANSKPKKEVLKKVCCSCPKEKAEQNVNNFYVSFSKLHADGYLPMCKECIQNAAFNDETNDVDIEKLKNILRQMDKPFIESVWQSSLNQYNKTYGGKNVKKRNRVRIIGYYFKNIQTLRQYVTLDWNGGIEWEKEMKKKGLLSFSENNEEKQNETPSPQKEDETYSLDEDYKNFKVTKDIIKLFGEGYSTKMYHAMWEKYEFLRKSYPDVTNLHVEALLTYVRFKVQEEMATAKGNAVDAEKWSGAATKAADKAKINPSQLSQSDLQGGLNSFSELFLALEQAVDVIPILPQFKFRANDSIDFTILCEINYLRELEGKPLCSYEDVYRFYDDRKREYVEQYGDPYGIFKDDPTEKNRENIKKFITLPNDYNDLGNDSSEIEENPNE